MRRLKLATLLACVLTVAPVVAAQTSPVDALTRARQLYNGEKFDEAVTAAAEARAMPTLANAAAVVEARARLERYRLSPDPADLVAARDALRTVDTAKLTARDHLEWSIGIGIALFLESEMAKDHEFYGASADYFDIALARADGIEASARDKIFEWWALALDRQAQAGAESERRPTYLRIVQRADRERTRSDAAASALYWQVAASRGAGDLDRAWNGAMSAWIIARTLGPRGVRLRNELEELVTKIVLPERARALTEAGDPRTTLTALVARWEEFKKKWE